MKIIRVRVLGLLWERDPQKHTMYKLQKCSQASAHKISVPSVHSSRLTQVLPHKTGCTLLLGVISGPVYVIVCTEISVCPSEYLYPGLRMYVSRYWLKFLYFHWHISVLNSPNIKHWF